MSQLLTNKDKLEQVLGILQTKASSGGVKLPELENEALAVELLQDKELINSKGNIVVGTMPNNGNINETMDGIDTVSITIPKGYTSGGTISLDSTISNEADEQANLIAQIKTAVNNLPDVEAPDPGGSATTLEWIDVSSLPTTYAIEMEDYRYLEISDSTKAVLLRVDLSGIGAEGTYISAAVKFSNNNWMILNSNPDFLSLAINNNLVMILTLTVSSTQYMII